MTKKFIVGSCSSNFSYKPNCSSNRLSSSYYIGHPTLDTMFSVAALVQPKELLARANTSVPIY